MKTLINCILFLGCLSVFAAKASINMDAKYSCTVTHSTDPHIPIGAKASYPIDLKKWVDMRFDSGSGFVFYGRLKPYYDGINDLVLALDANDPREIYATAYVQEISNKKISIDLLYLRTERKIDQINGGDHKFVFTSANNYSFECSNNNN